ncbi:MAG: hypothetical protein ACI9KE_001222 [Polyangiales bacterium]|jgi:hypothetical protein
MWLSRWEHMKRDSAEVCCPFSYLNPSYFNGFWGIRSSPLAKVAGERTGFC